MSSVNRVWTALLLLATVGVAAAVGYVLVHNDKVPQAGRTPGYTATAPVPTGGRSGLPTTSTSTSATGSGGPSSSTSGTSGTGGPARINRITFLGDNWTIGSGVGRNAAKAFPSLVAGALHLKVDAVGADGAGYAKHGPNGKNYSDLVGLVLASQPDIVVVSGGRNDVPDDVNTLDTAAKDLFSELKTKLPDAELVAIAPFWGDSDHPSDLTNVDDAVKTGVTAAGGTYINLPDPIHNHSDWMADAANPNVLGNKAIADALKPELQKLMTT